MSNTVISVIIPYLEDNEKITDTINSIVKQKRLGTAKIEVIIVDSTPNCSSKNAADFFSDCRVVACDENCNEAQAYEIGLNSVNGEYVTVSRCGDVFSNKFFSKCLACFTKYSNLNFVNTPRFCINPIYVYKKANITNYPLINIGTPISLSADPNFFDIELVGTLFKTDVLKSYKINTDLKYEYFQDLMIRLQLDYPNTIMADGAEYHCFMPLCDDSSYFVPSNHIEWYKQSIDDFLLPLAKSCIDRYKKIPSFVQCYIMFAVSSRFLANMNNRNKKNMDSNQLEEFISSVREILSYIDNTIVLNTNKYRCLDYSEEAAEMFYMLKYNCSFDKIPFRYIQGDRDVFLDCDSVILTRLTHQRVGMHVIDYRDGKVLIDGSYRRVFNLENLEIYALFNGKKYSLENTDRYSLTKYFGISSYKKFTFRLELELDPDLPEQRIQFFAKYKNTVVPLFLSFLHHWSKFTLSPINSYWRFNKYIAHLSDNSAIVIRHSSALRTLISELKFLPFVFLESKRMFITRIEYWMVHPFFKNKKIWLMYDKMYKGGDSCEYLYRFCADKNDGITRYYIIDKNTSDYKQLKKDGLKPVKNRSFKHKMIFLHTDIALITNSNCFPFNGYSMDRSRFILGLCNFPTMCLQHGLSVQKCAMAQQRVVDNTQMYFLASKYERKNLSHRVYNYDGFNILKMTGIGRYDGLISNDQKQILLHPTWRMYNAMPVTTSEGEQRSYNPDFKYTTYYKIYNDLINNKKLIDMAKRTGYKIKYLLHPILSAQVDDYTPDPYVEVISSVGDMSYEKVLTESSLMVTDYSGVQFDFAYMKKPLVYFHPSQLPAHYEDGGFFYDTMGFGEICTESEQLVDTLCEYMENGCKMKPEYVARVDDFYEFSDNNNCQRIYDEIMKFQEQVNIDKFKQ